MERPCTRWLLVLALALPVLGPVIALLILRRSEAKSVPWLRATWGILALQAVITSCLVTIVIRDYLAIEQTKLNALVLQEAILHWSVDEKESSVPETLDELVAKGYLSSLPVNPFTKQSVRNLPIDGRVQAGDVTYLPVYTVKQEYWEYRSSFGLIAYGPTWYKYFHATGPFYSPEVIITVDSGSSLEGLDTDGDGIADTKGCRSGLSCEDAADVYRGKIIGNWVTAAEYRKQRGEHQPAQVAP
jgi:hypothetical protein